MADAELRPLLRGLVLAGGRSERMGRDKAAIVVGGETLLEAAIRRLRPLVASVHVSIRPDQAGDAPRGGCAALADPPGSSGPPAGLLAAHEHDPAAAWLVLACDMPAIDAGVLEGLVAARDPARGGVAWRTGDDGLPEPLCAIWEPATLARLAALARGPGRGSVSPRAVLAASAPVLLNPVRPAALSSVNTPADLARYLGQTHAHKP
jgi:molybdopterin-guanine dinucleotide biosynthesis protein A